MERGLVQPVGDLGDLEPIIDIASPGELDHVRREVDADQSSSTLFQDHSRQSRSAADIEDRKIAPVADDGVDCFLDPLRRPVFQVLAHPVFVTRGETFIDLLDGPIGCTWRRRLVPQRRQQMLNLRIVGPQFQIFFISRTRLAAMPRDLRAVSEGLPRVGVVRHQLDDPFPAQESHLDLSLATETLGEVGQFGGGEFPVGRRRAIAPDEEAGLEPFLDPAIDFGTSARRQQRFDHFADVAKAPAAVAQFRDQRADRIKLVQTVADRIIDDVPILQGRQKIGGVYLRISHRRKGPQCSCLPCSEANAPSCITTSGRVNLAGSGTVNKSFHGP